VGPLAIDGAPRRLLRPSCRGPQRRSSIVSATACRRRSACSANSGCDQPGYAARPDAGRNRIPPLASTELLPDPLQDIERAIGPMRLLPIDPQAGPGKSTVVPIRVQAVDVTKTSRRSDLAGPACESGGCLGAPGVL